MKELAGVRRLAASARQREQVLVRPLDIGREIAVHVVLEPLHASEGKPFLRKLEVIAEGVVSAELGRPQPARGRAGGNQEHGERREGGPEECRGQGQDLGRGQHAGPDETADEEQEARGQRHPPAPGHMKDARPRERGVDHEQGADPERGREGGAGRRVGKQTTPDRGAQTEGRGQPQACPRALREQDTRRVEPRARPFADAAREEPRRDQGRTRSRGGRDHAAAEALA